jgi:hypothetical protein
VLILLVSKYAHDLTSRDQEGSLPHDGIARGSASIMAASINFHLGSVHGVSLLRDPKECRFRKMGHEGSTASKL